MSFYIPNEIIELIGEYTNNREFTILFFKHSKKPLLNPIHRFRTCKIRMLNEIEYFCNHQSQCFSYITIDNNKIYCKQPKSNNSLYCSMCSHILCR